MSALFGQLLHFLATALVAMHTVAGFLGGNYSWVVGIILLTVTVRLILFPLFVKQTKAQRAMQMLAPQMTALKEKYKNDKNTLNQEMMKLYKENGANPLAGCGPLVLQMPIFIGLFRVLRAFAPSAPRANHLCLNAAGNGVLGDAKVKLTEAAVKGAAKTAVCFSDHYGITAKTVAKAGGAKMFGAPISTGFSSSKGLLHFLNSGPTTTKIVAGTLIFLMALTTFVSQKQLMAKGAAAEGAQATQQKVLLYVMPVLLMFFGLTVPLGVLLYWTTTNLWSMGQQAVIIKHMPMPEPGATTPRPAPGKAGAPTPGKTGSGRSLLGGKQPAKTTRPITGTAREAKSGTGGTSTNGVAPKAEPAASGSSANGARSPAAGAGRPVNRPNKKKNSKGGRRGGRR